MWKLTKKYFYSARSAIEFAQTILNIQTVKLFEIRRYDLKRDDNASQLYTWVVVLEFQEDL